MKKMYTVREVCEVLGVARERIYGRIKAGKVKATKVTPDGKTKHHYLISEREFQKLLKNRLELYVEEKLDILKELHISPTPWQVEHMRECKSEFDIDAFYHDILTGKARTE